jgi:hypothetical protein
MLRLLLQLTGVLHQPGQVSGWCVDQLGSPAALHTDSLAELTLCLPGRVRLQRFESGNLWQTFRAGASIMMTVTLVNDTAPPTIPRAIDELREWLGNGECFDCPIYDSVHSQVDSTSLGLTWFDTALLSGTIAHMNRVPVARLVTAAPRGGWILIDFNGARVDPEMFRRISQTVRRLQ